LCGDCNIDFLVCQSLDFGVKFRYVGEVMGSVKRGKMASKQELQEWQKKFADARERADQLDEKITKLCRNLITACLPAGMVQQARDKATQYWCGVWACDLQDPDQSNLLDIHIKFLEEKEIELTDLLKQLLKFEIR